MKAKKVIIRIAVIALAFGLGVFTLALIIRPVPLSIGSIDLTTAQDGHYIGICQNKILFAVVDINVKDHALQDVKVLEHKASYLGVAQAVARQVQSKQSLEIDAISGATFTRDTVLKAIENGLKGEPLQ
ncbi:MAG: FMN-binding protein [Eubacteriales bacterium]|nr:FMN-binding protein [Eubacteriales bacterium]